ncbi:MAG: fatty acid hydroxylase family protein [Alphaproteobacteria bacterium]|nr:fatty acid hydroxylase family protein [Alphaproteobacteria bacterium]
MNEEAVKNYRIYFREKYISERYSGRRHLATTVTVTLIVIAVSLYNLENVQTWEWLTIPLALFLANFVEFLAHKGPMHKKTRYLEEIFQRHAVQHHSFFTHEFMEFDEEKDFNAVLFPPEMLLFFFGGIATPLGILSYFLFGGNVAWLFVFSVTLYFLNYEVMHFLYHVSEDAWTSNLPFMGFLRRHHTLHHDRDLMNDYNFNITYPVCDLLLGTYYRSGKDTN